MARILKKMRGYLDFYTSYNGTHLGFLQEITGKSFYIIFTFLNIFLLNSEKLMIIISNLKYRADRKFKSSCAIYSSQLILLINLQFSTSNHIINLFLLGRLEDGCLLRILLAKNNCFFLLQFLTPIHYWQLFGISRVFLIFFALPTSSGRVTSKI